LLLRLAMPQAQSILVRLILRLLFVPLMPVLILLAVLANCSLLGQGGDDCLGYTAISKRKSQ